MKSDAPTTDAETVEVCPECSSSQIAVRVTHPRDERYYCRECRAKFGTPDVREHREVPWKHRKGLAGEYRQTKRELHDVRLMLESDEYDP